MNIRCWHHRIICASKSKAVIMVIEVKRSASIDDVMMMRAMGAMGFIALRLMGTSNNTCFRRFLA
jgi:hypothetical protein